MAQWGTTKLEVTVPFKERFVFTVFNYVYVYTSVCWCPR